MSRLNSKCACKHSSNTVQSFPLVHEPWGQRSRSPQQRVLAIRLTLLRYSSRTVADLFDCMADAEEETQTLQQDITHHADDRIAAVPRNSSSSSSSSSSRGSSSGSSFTSFSTKRGPRLCTNRSSSNGGRSQKRRRFSNCCPFPPIRSWQKWR